MNKSILQAWPWLLIALASFLLNACSSFSSVKEPPPSSALPPVSSAALWEQRKSQLENLQHWDLNGRIAIKDGSQGWQASVRWQQQQANYTIDLIGPLGQGQVKINGNETTVQLRDGNAMIDADDPDSLLERATGTRLPVAGLYYWIRGIPDPNLTSEIAFDQRGRLTRIEQTGWVIEYPNYILPDQSVTASELELPKRINAEQNDLKIKIIVQTWSLANPS